MRQPQSAQVFMDTSLYSMWLITALVKSAGGMGNVQHLENTTCQRTCLLNLEWILAQAQYLKTWVETNRMTFDLHLSVFAYTGSFDTQNEQA